MNETATLELGVLLLELALLFGLTYLLAVPLRALRIPPILGALFVAMAIHYTPLGRHLQSPPEGPVFDLLANLGVMLLLFYIGLQIDLREMRAQGRDIVWLTVLNTSLPFLAGTAVMLWLGYGWVLALVVGISRMPTAEAVIVPILDEFRLLDTRVGRFIVGTGVMDDVIEVFLVAVVSVWIGSRAVSHGALGWIENDLLAIAAALLALVVLTMAGYRWIVPALARGLGARPRSLVMLSMLVLFAVAGFTEHSDISMVVGAITAGVLMRPVYNRAGALGTQATTVIRAITYGFFGPIFFYWVGLSVDLEGLLRQPELAGLLFGAAFFGKLAGVWLMVPMHKLSPREAWTVGVGINARLTTEIIIAKLLLDAGLIDVPLFTALVAASSLSTLLVPLLFSLLVRAWGDALRQRQAALPRATALAAQARRPWHALPPEAVLAALDSDARRGLDPAEARRRLARHGPNTLAATRRTPWYAVFARQFVDVLILILLAAAAIAWAIGELGDALTILAIVALNGLLGFTQEWRAEQALAALQQMLSPRCRVRRGGALREIDARALVPGDIVLLEIGDRVPADLRLLEAIDLQVDESALTGESLPVRKAVAPVAEAAPLAERRSMAWMGTAVTNGRATGVVVATGMATEFGRIAHLTQSVGQETTPLQRKLAVLGRQLGTLSVAVSILVALAGWLTGKPLLEMFLTGVSLAVAVVPEGLPAVVTISLALGIRAMVRRRALLRRLQAAETLGSATVICTDKTGTLTQNEMTVRHLWLPAGPVTATGVGYDPAGHFEARGRRVDYRHRPDLLALLRSALLCNHARVEKDRGGWRAIGEPTEAALVVAAYKAWLSPGHGGETVAEFSFNSRRKRMTVIERRDGVLLAHVKGAPEVLLARCSRLLVGRRERPLDGHARRLAETAYRRMADAGLRTLAIAVRRLPPDTPLQPERVERELTLLGIVGILDPPRPEVPAAIRTARRAGVRTLMITGDAAATALAIARRIGLPARSALTGTDLERLDDATLAQRLRRDAPLFARVTPEHKLRIVDLLQKQGEIVAMTGDGVNDAPALKKADIGIAMGRRGTDVARAASDMVLTDDNFASIVGAIEEGRRQYDNIQKFVRYLLSSNTGEVLAITGNILLGGPLILLPVQILWMNLITDGMTAVALGVEPAERGIMQRPPRGAHEPILDRAGMVMIALLGGYIGAASLWLFQHALATGASVAAAQTVAFTGLIVLEKMNVLNYRALRAPLRLVGFFSNPWVLAALAVTLGLQVLAVYHPFLQRALHTVPLGWADWARIIGLALPLFLVTEAWKTWRWRRAARRGRP